MNPAVINAMKFDSALVTPALAEVAGEGPVSLEWLGGGRNSRVYRVDRGGREAYVAKLYHTADHASQGSWRSWFRIPMADAHSIAPRARDRRGCEFAALRFLWRNEIRCIPEPIATFPEQALSIFRLVEGSPLSCHDVTDRDIDALADFLVRLDALKLRPASRALSDASEACFSLGAIAESIRVRLAHLHAAAYETDSAPRRELRSFLTDAITPVLERGLEVAARQFAARGLGIDTELPIESRTLSPSDFGFHNALRRPDGSLVFVDFEHFGWDDPAKMVSDFLLHPALPISLTHRRRFTRRTNRSHSAGDFLAWRVPLVYPLYALKWCTILLNEFVREHQSRRAFATQASPDPETALLGQLAKAKSMLETASLAQERFPHAA